MRRHTIIAAVVVAIAGAAGCGGSSESSAQPARFCTVHAAEMETIGNNGMVGKNNKDQAADALLASAKRLEKAAPAELRANAAKITAYAQRNADIRHRYANEIDHYRELGIDPPAEWRSFLLAGGPTDDFAAIEDYADTNCT